MNTLRPNLVEIDGFEPPRPRRAQDLQSRAIDRYAISPKLYTFDISFADALFAMTHMLYSSLHLIIIVTQA